MAESAFREVFGFFEDIGVFDVVLPFLLAFTIVFAILEKTKVLGMEEVDGKKYTKKNLNAITAFVMAFLVVASSRLVEIITEVSANAVVLLFLSILFLLLAGSFHQESGESFFLKDGGWRTIFMMIMFVGIIGIFLDALQTDDGDTWLEATLDFFGGTGNDVVVGSVIFLVIIIIFMTYILKDDERSKHDSH